jgi:hypothetical protein
VLVFQGGVDGASDSCFSGVFASTILDAETQACYFPSFRSCRLGSCVVVERLISTFPVGE